MFLLKFIAMLATFAFMTTPSSSVSIPESTNMDVVVVRRDYKSLPNILADVTTALSTHLEALTYIKSENATLIILAPIIADMKTIVSTATVEVNQLAGQPVGVILGGGNVTVAAFSLLVGNLLVAIFAPLGAVISAGTPTSLETVLPLLTSLGEAVGDLVKAILFVTADVFADLTVLILNAISTVALTIVQLNVTVVMNILGIKVSG